MTVLADLTPRIQAADDQIAALIKANAALSLFHDQAVIDEAALRAALATCQGQLPPPSLPTYPSGFSFTTDPGPHWRQVWAEDFKTACAEGQFGLAYSSIGAYAAGWPDTTQDTSRATYSGSAYCSVSGGTLKVRLWRGANGPAHVTNLQPNNSAGLLGMRTSAAYRYVGPFVGGYHPIPHLFWPKDEIWPLHGEFDYPEGDTTAGQLLSGFTHYAQPANIEPHQDEAKMGVHYDNAWHEDAVEWVPNTSVTYIRDGKVIAKHTKKVSNFPMRWCVQLESGQQAPAAFNSQLVVEFDHMRQHVYVP